MALPFVAGLDMENFGEDWPDVGRNLVKSVMAAALQQSISSSLWRPLSHRGLQLSVDLHEFTVAESNSNMKGLVTTVECLYQEATDDALFDEEEACKSQ